MGQYKISKAGLYYGGCAGVHDALRAVAQTQARIFLAAGGANLTLTDNTGGIVSVANAINFPAPVFDAPANGNDRATGASVDAALGVMSNSLSTLFAIANAAATLLGVEGVQNNGGGTAANNNTLAALNTAVAGAAVGPAAALFTQIMAAANLSVYDLYCMIKKLQVATGHNELVTAVPAGPGITYGLGPNTLYTGTGVIVENIIPTQQNITYGRGPNFPGTGYTPQARATVTPLIVASGPTSATGVSAVAAQATLATYAGNISTMAAALSALSGIGILGLRATS